MKKKKICKKKAYSCVGKNPKISSTPVGLSSATCLARLLFSFSEYSEVTSAPWLISLKVSRIAVVVIHMKSKKEKKLKEK
jgi:hypothetical protein